MRSYKNSPPTLDDVIIPPIISNSYTDFENIYFAFIDVLGFKNNYMNEKNNIDTYKNIFSFYFDLMGSTKFMSSNPTDSYIGQTSDSLYFYTKRQDYLVEFILLFLYFNVYAMTKDVFFRGGISKGKLSYKENHQFFGDSVIRAYLIESSVAQSPRIVIDEDTYQDIKKEKHFDKIIKRENGRYYLEPFAYFANKEYIDTLLMMNNVELSNWKVDKSIINQNILNQKHKFECDNKNFGKYTFLENKLREYEV